MSFRIFSIAIRAEGAATDELNRFLQNHKVLSIDRRWVDLGTESLWVFCIDYWEGGGPGQMGATANASSRVRVDYKEQLSAEDFAIFAKLRDWRKATAQADAVPVYTVFTNEQLAQMVRDRVTNRTSLEAITGVGDARIEKFGERILEVLKSCWPESNEKS